LNRRASEIGDGEGGKQPQQGAAMPDKERAFSHVGPNTLLQFAVYKIAPLG
jgi:hypothetical protein